MYSLACFTVLLFALLHPANSAVTLTPQYSGDACPNTNATVTCISDTGQLTWAGNPGDTQSYGTDANQIGLEHSVGPFTVQLVSVNGNTLNSTATINATTNGTSIQCRDAPANNFNFESHTIVLATAPGSPQNFTNISATFDSVTLSWTQPITLGGVIALDGYIIQVSPSPGNGGCPESECRPPASATSTTINNLQYGTQYTFSIIAVNCAGNSSPETVSVAVVANEPAPPTNLSVCVSGQLLKVTWDCPSSTSPLSPPISNYVVSSSISSGLQSTHPVPSVGCNCTYTLFVTAQSNTLHTISVSANNTVGLSDGNPTTSIYTSPNITSESLLESSTSTLIGVNVSWVTCPGLQADLQFTYMQNGQSSTRLLPVTLPLRGTGYIPLTGLQMDTSYTLTVQVIMSGGVSAGSLSANFVTMRENNDIISPSQCSGIVVTATETIVVTASSSPGEATSGQQECATNGNFLLGIGVLGTVAVIAIVLVLILSTCVLYLKTTRKTRIRDSSERDRDFTMSNQNMRSHQDISMSGGSHANLLSPNGLELTMNDSYGQAPLHHPPSSYISPAVNSYADTQMYAEIPNGDRIVTNNPTYAVNNTHPVPIAEGKTEPVYLACSGENDQLDIYMEGSDIAPSPPTSARPSDVNNPTYGQALQQGGVVKMTNVSQTSFDPMPQSSRVATTNKYDFEPVDPKLGPSPPLNPPSATYDNVRR